MTLGGGRRNVRARTSPLALWLTSQGLRGEGDHVVVFAEFLPPIRYASLYATLIARRTSVGAF